MALLFFYDKFHLARRDTAWINIVHRISYGLPMVLSTLWISRPSKWLFAATVALEGVFVSATALPGNVKVAVVLWFFHDALGAAIWAPINQWYMQHYARPEHRASNVATVAALSTVGSTIGPIIAGRLARYGGAVPWPLTRAIDLPFFISGVVVLLSAILVCALPHATAEHGEPSRPA
jgi:MFS family permease